MYVTRYRHARIKGGPEGDSSGNPESLEQFLLKTPHFHVIMKAFYFEMNTQYGYDFWHDVNKKWLKYWEIHQDNLANSKYITLRGSFSILRQNWDKPLYWKSENLESPEETYKRMGIEPPEIDDDGDRYYTSKPKPKFKVGDTVRGTISGDVCKIIEVSVDHSCYLTDDDGAIDFDREDYWELVPEAAQEVEEKTMSWEEPRNPTDLSYIPEAQEEQKKEPENFLDGFSLEDIANSVGSKRLANNTISVNLGNGSYKVTFSVKESDKIRKHSHKYVKLLTKKSTMEIALTFNNSNGCTVSSKMNSAKNTRNITINSKEMVMLIQKFFETKEDYFHLEIVSTTLVNDNTTYILKMKE